MQELAAKPTDRGREMFKRARDRLDALECKVLEAGYLSDVSTAEPDDDHEVVYVTFDSDFGDEHTQKQFVRDPSAFVASQLR